MEYTVYILQDEKGRKYTGYTSDLEKRKWQHNNGLSFYTRRGRNWKLVYSEKYASKTEALTRERFLKSGQGRDFIKKHCGIV